MISRKHILVASIAVVMASASAALAGTKSQANLVPDDVGNPTLDAKGKLAVKDTGLVQASLKGVTDGTGNYVTTSQSYKNSGGDPNSVDGTQYMVILKLSVADVELAPFCDDPNDLAPRAEVPIPVDLKGGNGGSKLDLSGLAVLLPPGVMKSLEVVGGEVWGPLGTDTLSDCISTLKTGFHVVGMGPNPCKGGDKIGVAGIVLP